MHLKIKAQGAVAVAEPFLRGGRSQSFSNYANYGLLAILLALVVPAFKVARLPFQVDFLGLAEAYWGGTAVRAIFAAVILSLLASKPRFIFAPMLQRYRRQKLRLLICAVLCVWMVALFGGWFGSLLVVNALAIAELLDRTGTKFGAVVVDVLAPAAYLFIGVLLIYLLNHAIAGMKFAGSCDTAFERADQLIFRTSVSAVSAWIATRVSPSSWELMEMVYFSLFGQVGGAIIIAAIKWGRPYAMRYVGTLMTAYVIALICFFFWPSIGPFSIYPASTRVHLLSLPTYWTQEAIRAKASMLSFHKLTPAVITVNLADYYIGFPSMHIALPVIALWFLRRSRRMALLLFGFDVLLLISIIALQWHYLVDLAAGLIVGALAIWLQQVLHALAEPEQVSATLFRSAHGA